MLNTRANPKLESVPAIRAYLGGSFNPVHDGHIQMAMLVYERLLPIAERQHGALHVALMPNARSPFKDKTTSPKHRLAMLQLAIKGTPLTISELELWQTPPVYSIDSVRQLRRRYPNDILIFIMGMDSAVSLNKWKNGLQLTDYVHLWVFNREDKKNNQPDILPAASQIDTLNNEALMALAQKLPPALQSQITFCVTTLMPHTDISNQTIPPLKSATDGRIYMDARIIPAISSTQIRRYFDAQTSPPTAHDLPHIAPLPLNQQVYHYIITHQLYSTAQLL